ncbi:helix-turn-helix domain-containing protein [Natrialbaceae archaeon A-CW3]
MHSKGTAHGGSSESSEIFQVLADDYARQILLEADGQPMTAKGLSDACDASLATIYRRVSMLQEHDLLEERTSIGPDGSHRSEFETVLEGLHVSLAGGELTLTLETRDELADNFTALWDELRGDR